MTAKSEKDSTQSFEFDDFEVAVEVQHLLRSTHKTTNGSARRRSRVQQQENSRTSSPVRRSRSAASLLADALQKRISSPMRHRKSYKQGRKSGHSSGFGRATMTPITGLKNLPRKEQYVKNATECRKLFGEELAKLSVKIANKVRDLKRLQHENDDLLLDLEQKNMILAMRKEANDLEREMLQYSEQISALFDVNKNGEVAATITPAVDDDDDAQLLQALSEKTRNHVKMYVADWRKLIASQPWALEEAKIAAEESKLRTQFADEERQLCKQLEEIELLRKLREIAPVINSSSSLYRDRLMDEVLPIKKAD